MLNKDAATGHDSFFHSALHHPRILGRAFKENRYLESEAAYKATSFSDTPTGV